MSERDYPIAIIRWHLFALLDRTTVSPLDETNGKTERSFLGRILVVMSCCALCTTCVLFTRHVDDLTFARINPADRNEVIYDSSGRELIEFYPDALLVRFTSNIDLAILAQRIDSFGVYMTIGLCPFDKERFVWLGQVYHHGKN